MLEKYKYHVQWGSNNKTRWKTHMILTPPLTHTDTHTLEKLTTSPNFNCNKSPKYGLASTMDLINNSFLD